MKFYIAFFICLLVTTSAFSQFHFGVKAGIGFSDIRWNSSLAADETTSLTAFHIGVFSKVKIFNKLSLIPELQYITKGYSTDGDPSVGVEAFKLKNNYVELPVLVNYQIIKWIDVEAGPSLGIRVGGNSKMAFNELVDFGVLGGLRFNVTQKLSIMGRYNYGLSAIEKVVFNTGPNPSSYSGTIKAYNNSIQLSVAYQIK